MYSWPTTHPRSEAAHHVSPGLKTKNTSNIQNDYFDFAVSRESYSGCL